MVFNQFYLVWHIVGYNIGLRLQYWKFSHSIFQLEAFRNCFERHVLYMPIIQYAKWRPSLHIVLWPDTVHLDMMILEEQSHIYRNMAWKSKKKQGINDILFLWIFTRLKKTLDTFRNILRISNTFHDVVQIAKNQFVCFSKSIITVDTRYGSVI